MAADIGLKVGIDGERHTDFKIGHDSLVTSQNLCALIPFCKKGNKVSFFFLLFWISSSQLLFSDYSIVIQRG